MANGELRPPEPDYPEPKGVRIVPIDEDAVVLRQIVEAGDRDGETPQPDTGAFSNRVGDDFRL